jgi:hypothetical protein
MAATVIATIHDQIRNVAPELQTYPPTSVDWVTRAFAAADVLIPWLTATAPELKNHVEQVLNSPHRLRSKWNILRYHASLPIEQIEAFDRELSYAKILLEFVSGEVVSTIVTAHLVAAFPNSGLKSNGKSDYPDLFLVANEYANLPKFTRNTREYGAALKGRPPRPVRIPDGMEVKTCRDAIAVDCHHPHAGLHLVVLFDESMGEFCVRDICVAFLGRTDYREAGRNTTATTVKYSFKGEKFISLLHASKSG